MKTALALLLLALVVSPIGYAQPVKVNVVAVESVVALKAWLGIGTIEAPAVVKGAIWTAAQLEDTFGIVHSDLLREINKFVHNRCPKRL